MMTRTVTVTVMVDGGGDDDEHGGNDDNDGVMMTMMCSCEDMAQQRFISSAWRSCTVGDMIL
eukprot:11225548-Karenia_brevis.AAC.1